MANYDLDVQNARFQQKLADRATGKTEVKVYPASPSKSDLEGLSPLDRAFRQKLERHRLAELEELTRPEPKPTAKAKAEAEGSDDKGAQSKKRG